MELEFIRPNLLNNGIVESYFTLKNNVLENGVVKGLNLGFNTIDEEAIVSANRSLLLRTLNLDIEQFATAQQIHSNEVIYVEKGGMYENVDGLVTNKDNIALAIQVADCGAVLIADTTNKVIGAAHAGWRGARSGVIENTIELMKKYGGEPDNMNVFISPCISLRNFEVGKEVATQFPDEVVDYEHFTKPHIDLVQYIRTKVEELGVSSERIEVNGRCTVEESNSFYSYRREKEKSGRMMGIIKLTPNV